MRTLGILGLAFGLTAVRFACAAEEEPQSTSSPFTHAQALRSLRAALFDHTDSALEALARAEWAALRADDPTAFSSYVLCAPYINSGAVLSRIAQDTAIDPSGSLIYQSRAQARTCFHARLTLEEAERVLSAAGSDLSVTPVPPGLKAGRDVLHALSGSMGSWADSGDHFLALHMAPPSSPRSSTKGETRRSAHHLAERVEVLRRIVSGLSSEPGGDDAASTTASTAASVAPPNAVEKAAEHVRFAVLGQASLHGDVSTCNWAELKFGGPEGIEAWEEKEEKEDEEEENFVSLGNHLGLHRDAQQRRGCLRRVLLALVGHHDVLSVQVDSTVARTMNQAGSSLLQRGGTHATGSDFSYPLNELGLTGAGHIAQVSDTGLDRYHCFYYDTDKGSVVATSNYNSVTTDLTQRKVVQYAKGSAGGDGGDCKGGHGTHVSGSVAGDVYAGWAGAPDTCASSTDLLANPSCEVPDTYSNCADVLAYCDNMDVFTQQGCDMSCYCKLGGEFVTSEQSCTNMIVESKGVAPDAKIAFKDYTDGCADSLAATRSEFVGYALPAAYDIGARVSTHSWGGDASCAGSYTSWAKTLDDYLASTPDMTVLFSAGNEGNDCETSEASISYQSYSKNAIIVGASETGRYSVYGSAGSDANNLASFSSIGNTDDGRFKPDIVAPGYYIVSANASGTDTQSCGIVSMSGTSMATPLVAGGAILVRQYFLEGWYGRHRSAQAALLGEDCFYNSTACGNFSYVSGALVKAVIANSGQSLTGWRDSDLSGVTDLDESPTKQQGFGRIALNWTLPTHSAPFNDDNNVFVYAEDNTTGLRAYQQLRYKWLLYDASEEFSATLSWTDPLNPNWQSASKQLVHDLDLYVVDGSGTVHYPNGGSEADEVNNVERVRISTPSTDLTVVVECGSLSESDTQPFALVIRGGGVITTSSRNLTHVVPVDDDDGDDDDTGSGDGWIEGVVAWIERHFFTLVFVVLAGCSWAVYFCSRSRRQQAEGRRRAGRSAPGGGPDFATEMVAGMQTQRSLAGYPREPAGPPPPKPQRPPVGGGGRSYPAQAPTVASAGPRLVPIVIPQGAVAGTTLRVDVGEGSSVLVTIPEGCTPGETIAINVP